MTLQTLPPSTPSRRPMPRRPVVRLLLAAGLLVTSMPLAATAPGCARGSAAPDPLGTPVFGSRERFAQIRRNIGLEWQMLNDDIDRALLLRPVSGLTEWNIP